MLSSRPVTLLLAAAVGAAFVAGLLVEGVGGGIILLVVAAVLTALTVAAWDHRPERGRSLRLVVLGLVWLLALVKVVRGLA